MKVRIYGADRSREAWGRAVLAPTALAMILLVVRLAHAAAPGAPGTTPSDPRAMTQERMESRIQRLAGPTTGRPGALDFTYRGVWMACVSDALHDRMRIIAPVVAVDTMTAEQVQMVLEANFHTALDARYAVSRGVLFAAYIHPLGSLTDAELESALGQVAELARSYGTTYSSGALDFARPPAVPSQ